LAAEGDREGMAKKVMIICFLLVVFIMFSVNAYAKDYVIGDGDSLKVSVWGNPELSITTTVRPDGKISLPALGEIETSGLTPMELTGVLEKEMSKVVKTPIVTVIVTGMTNYKIFVIGRGVTPGAYTLQRETTLLEFLAQLGSLDLADLESAYLVRNKKKIKTNFVDLFEKGDYSQDVTLESNDMLFIPDNFNKRIRIVGAVNGPTTITYREGLTILDVILSAGGFTQFAKENDVKVLREKEKGGREEITVRSKDLMKKGVMRENIAMKPGDVVIVQEKLF
jgi:polysaccharide export outer membrane protein